MTSAIATDVDEHLGSHPAMVLEDSQMVHRVKSAHQLFLLIRQHQEIPEDLRKSKIADMFERGCSIEDAERLLGSPLSQQERDQHPASRREARDRAEWDRVRVIRRAA